MIEIVFGTSNPGKLADVRVLVDPSIVTVLGLQDIGVEVGDIVENGKTFEENSIIKYEALRPLVPDNYILVTEDAGLEVDALNGEPGVYSRRWNKERREMTDQELVDKMARVMNGKKDRTARFVVVATFAGSGIKRQTVRAEELGVMLDEPDVEGMESGLPFRAFFFIPELDTMLYKFHLLPKEERKGHKTHREKIWEQIVENLQK